MAISKGKKRYYITLDQETMDHVQGLISELKLPRQTLSLVIDEFLCGDLVPRLESVLEKKRSGQPPSFSDLFLTVGATNLVTQGEHRGKFVELHLKEVTEDGTMVVTPKLVDEEQQNSEE